MYEFLPVFFGSNPDLYYRHGQPFEVLATYTEPTEEVDAKNLPAFRVQFPDGEIFIAYKEEVLASVDGKPVVVRCNNAVLREGATVRKEPAAPRCAVG